MTHQQFLPRTFLLVPYMAAVAVGCLLSGAMLPFSNLLIGQIPTVLDIGMWAVSALIGGFLPGLLLCLPTALLSLSLSRRLSLDGLGWYLFSGAVTGLCIGALFAFILLVASHVPAATAMFYAVTFGVSGAFAGLTYRRIERLENAARLRRET